MRRKEKVKYLFIFMFTRLIFFITYRFRFLISKESHLHYCLRFMIDQNW